ncbi:MAG: WD40-like beta Propeller containing protein [Bacteroidetes bacterium]|nr:WD40-like beta Propeller containing protein [Bacteroidota bacterium]
MKQFLKPTLLHSFLWVACLSAGLVFTIYSVSWMPRVTHGFTMYYTFARMVLEGEDFSRIYNVDYFDAKVSEYGMNTKDIPNNLPTNALVLLPVAWLPPSTAKIVWSVISLVAFALSMKMMLRVYGIPTTSNLGLGLMTLCLAWRPAYDNIALGQLYMVMLLLFTLSLRGIQKNNMLTAGLTVGTAILIKGYGVVPALWMIARRKWKMVLLTVAFIVLVFMLTLPLFGVGSWTQFYASVVTNLWTSPSGANVAYQTINGFVHHLFFYDPIWSPFPVARLPYRS